MSPFDPAFDRLEPVLYEQDGFISTWQAEAMGVSRPVLQRLVDAGSLERLQVGVYRSLRGAEVMPRVETSLYADYLALDGRRLPWDRSAITIAASHATAADLLAIGTVPAEIHEFTSSARRRTVRPTIRLWVAPLDDSDVSWQRDDRIPCTTASRTIVDLAMAGTDPDYVRRMLADALHRRLTDRSQVLDVLERRIKSARRVPVSWLRRELQEHA